MVSTYSLLESEKHDHTNKKGSHTVHDIKYHIIWVTKYRYKVKQL